MAAGADGIPALEASQWFDTNYLLPDARNCCRFPKLTLPVCGDSAAIAGYLEQLTFRLSSVYALLKLSHLDGDFT